MMLLDKPVDEGQGYSLANLSESRYSAWTQHWSSIRAILGHFVLSISPRQIYFWLTEARAARPIHKAGPITSPCVAMVKAVQ